MKLSEISWPIYKIRQYTALNTERGITYIETYHNSWLIDNKNLKGDTLGERRLRMDKEDLYPLSGVIFNISQLVHDKSQTRKYIDSSGELFTYKKERFYKVTCHKVLKIKPIEGQGYAIWAKGLHAPMQVRDMPLEKIQYVTVVNIKKGYFLYDIRTEACKDTRRKL